MSEFLAAILVFPTVVFTVLMGIVLLYWSLAILGALDIDLLDFDVDSDVDMDLDLDLDVDAGGDLDADGGDVDADGHHGHGGGLLGMLGLAGVPITVAISLTVFFSWVLCILLSGWVLPSVAGSSLATIATIAVGLGALLLAIPPAAICAKPMKRFFVTHDAVRRREHVGKVCTITTGRVSADFGQAQIDDGGAGSLVQVRCPRDNDLRRDSQAVIYEYDAADEVFLVAPAESLEKQE